MRGVGLAAGTSTNMQWELGRKQDWRQDSEMIIRGGSWSHDSEISKGVLNRKKKMGGRTEPSFSHTVIKGEKSEEIEVYSSGSLDKSNQWDIYRYTDLLWRIGSHNHRGWEVHDPLTASWRLWKAGGTVLVQAQRPEQRGAKVQEQKMVDILAQTESKFTFPLFFVLLRPPTDWAIPPASVRAISFPRSTDSNAPLFQKYPPRHLEIMVYQISGRPLVQSSGHVTVAITRK